MYTTNLRKVGGSVMLTVPPSLLEMLHLQAGAAVGLSVEGGHLVVDPQPRKRYSLEDLLAQCDPGAALPVEDQAWTTSAPVGRELI